ncbi:MAG: PAS domain S-box protein [Deltaproteobacteria bacterium]|nr:PAS domain S-box protein [Deltaproteobacteria bacterium]
MEKRECTPAEDAEQAKAWLRSKKVGKNLTQTMTDLRRLLHELQRHQVELEFQNEELRRTWEGLKLSPNKYDKLYNLSPIGYFTFDVHGLIREVNPAGAQLLGIERQLLVNKPFFSFITDADDRDIFSSHLESALQRQGMQKCEISLTRNDGTVTYWQLQSVAVETIETKDVYVLTSFVDGTIGKHFWEELQNTYDKLELTVNERTGELNKALEFLADLYCLLGNPHPNHQNASTMPGSTAGFDTLKAAAIGRDDNLEESTQSSTAPLWRNFSFFANTPVKNIRLYVLCALAIITAVSFVLLQLKGKMTGVEQKKTEKNMAGSFELQTSAGKMKQEDNLFAVIKFKVSPQGAIYINGEKKGVATMLSELQVKEGKYTIAIKYKNYTAYRKVVNIAPQERILIEHSFHKSTATATKKNITAGKSTSKREKAPRKIYPVIFTTPAIKKNITVNKRSIMRLSNSQARVWVRIKDNPHSMIKAQEKEGLPTQGYDNYSHTLVLQEFDCKKRAFNSIQINDYDTKGKVLWSSRASKVNKQPIVPGSVGETVYNVVCQGSK